MQTLEYSLSSDAKVLSIETERGGGLFLDRNEALQLLNTLQAALPQMAVKI